MISYALIGYPLGHTASPFIHRELFALSGREGDYAALEIPPQELPGRIEGLRALGGFNVTIPHKLAIQPLLDRLEESARLCGAVNTVKTDGGELVGYNTDMDGFLHAVPEDLLKSLSTTETPQGVLFLCRTPRLALPEAMEGRRYLVLDGVQDPGNVGTVLRTADAFGADGLILLPGCADPFAPKTVRASMGACFRLPVWEADRETLTAALERAGLPLYAAALGTDTGDVRQVDLRRAAVAAAVVLWEGWRGEA